MLTVDLTIQGPFITQSSAPGAYGLDAPMARDPQGRDYIPGSHVAGKLREAWMQLADILPGQMGPPTSAMVDDWLGKKTGASDGASGDVEPARKRLVLADLYPEREGGARRDRRFRIALDGARGAVDDRALQIIEAPYAAGEAVKFSGEAHFLARNGAEAGALRRALEIGLHWIGQIGAERTVGFGRLLKAQVGEPRMPNAAPCALAATDLSALDLTLRLEGPFCLARRSPTANLFESLDTIPGGAIKGVIAQTWAAVCGRSQPKVDKYLDPERVELGTWFHALRFTHAFPAALPGVRPVAWPDSLVKVGKAPEPADLALSEGPVLLPNEDGDWRAPAFRVDWKDQLDVAERFGWPSLTRELRVRTAIDGGKRRAKDEQLFAYEMIWPWGPADTEGNGHAAVDWYARVDLSRISETQRQPVVEQLASLIGGGLLGLGKTKAPIHAELHSPGHFRDACPSSPAPLGDLWLLTLQTPALLCDPDKLSEASGCRELGAAYADAWDDLSGASLRLVRYFARQTLAGGGYLHRRFGPHGRVYRPYLLTEPGGVFVLAPVAGREIEARRAVEGWLVGGLPLPGWAKARYGEDWRSCPYIPENGYGEIAVNLACHTELQPRKTLPLAWEP